MGGIGGEAILGKSRREAMAVVIMLGRHRGQQERDIKEVQGIKTPLSSRIPFQDRRFQRLITVEL